MKLGLPEMGIGGVCPNFFEKVITSERVVER